MKKLLTLLLTLVTVFTFAQNVPGEKITPQVVKDKFKTEYPTAALKKWDPRPLKKEYIAIFTDQNLNKRARYNSAGEPMVLVTSYTKAEIPAVYLSKISEQYPGFVADWATEFKFFYKNTSHFIEIRLSKPGFVLKAWVKPDGSPYTGNSNSLDADGEPMQETQPQ
jgi:hypothetical protein